MPPPRPLIGVTTYPPNAAGRFELPALYVACLRRAGADVVLLPPGVGTVTGLLARLDGLVLAGGGDLDPARYDGAEHETVYGIDRARDGDEIAMVHGVVASGLPTLAICRGSQVLNVALGGTLVAHLPDTGARTVVGDEVRHRIEPVELRGMPAPVRHAVEVEAGSLVATVMGTTSVAPMSWHHQAVDRIGAGLRVVARAPDGTVEATEHDDHPWLASVQWHPELTAAQDPTQQALFVGLVAAAAEARGPRTTTGATPSPPNRKGER